MRIVHTSDWHLGRTLYSVHLTEDQAHVLEKLVELVTEFNADVVVIAGDVYDRSIPPLEAVKLLDHVLSRIILKLGIPVIMIAGNHDSPERLSFGKHLMKKQGLYVRGGFDAILEPITIPDEHGQVYFYTVPYIEPSVVKEKNDLNGSIDHDRCMEVMIGKIRSLSTVANRSVLLTHAFVSGSITSDSERPLSIGGAGTVDERHFRGFNYTALGHLHKPQFVSKGKRKNKLSHQHVVNYSGSLMKYSFQESNHVKSVTLVEIDGKGNVRTELVSLSPRRDVRCIRGYLKDILVKASDDPCREDYVSVIIDDPEAILDVMGKLRTVYPNVLHVDRSKQRVIQRKSMVAVDREKMTEKELFVAFFKEVTGEEISRKELKVFEKEIDELHREERESGS